MLLGGRTLHSTFKIPIEIHEGSTCSIGKHSDLAGLIRAADLVIWDEAPMCWSYRFQAQLFIISILFLSSHIDYLTSTLCNIGYNLNIAFISSLNFLTEVEM